ncbi:prepilin peptidase [Candidatus Uhrbacteria bacterium]|nr:prepilin peptidase [Candidatus Uhrbacteria bacterium]
MLEPILSVALAFILGACLGSFANVIAIRLHDMSSLLGRSRCPSCRKVIRPRHLVPILSWLVLRGRCASCGKRIHYQYPVVEALMAVAVAIAALRHPPYGPDAPLFVFETLLLLGLVVIVVMDLRWKELPLELMAGLGVLGCFMHLGVALPAGTEAVFSAARALLVAVAVPVVFFGLQWLLSKGRWLGSGDIWMGGMMGLLLGTWQLSVIAVYLAYVIGGAVVAVLLLARVVKRGTRVPFGPALAVGLLLTMWSGDILTSYLAYAFPFAS